LSEQAQSALNDWAQYDDPCDGHPAADAAWIHVPTECRLVKVWIADDATRRAGAGFWEYRVLHPSCPRANLVALRVGCSIEKDKLDLLLNVYGARAVRKCVDRAAQHTRPPGAL
jgi:hypothetical protein